MCPNGCQQFRLTLPKPHLLQKRDVLRVGIAPERVVGACGVCSLCIRQAHQLHSAYVQFYEESKHTQQCINYTQCTFSFTKNQNIHNSAKGEK
eukprot:6048729-Pyramimonas_sp.AAC.1